MKIETFSIGGIGQENEDRLLVQHIGTDTIMAVLADGMGGLDSGSVAAEIVVEAIVNFIKDNFNGNNERDILYNALHYANKQIAKTNEEKKIKTGAAVAVVLITNNHLYYTWQGNVRIYVYKHEYKELITQDHIADTGYGKTALTRCIKGSELRDDVPICYKEIASEDTIWICSDGFYNATESIISVFPFEIIKEKMQNLEDDASCIIISPNLKSH